MFVFLGWTGVSVDLRKWRSEQENKVRKPNKNLPPTTGKGLRIYIYWLRVLQSASRYSIAIAGIVFWVGLCATTSLSRKPKIP